VYQILKKLHVEYSAENEKVPRGAFWILYDLEENAEITRREPDD
jgi:hypothetical protein